MQTDTAETAASKGGLMMEPNEGFDGGTARPSSCCCCCVSSSTPTRVSPRCPGGVWGEVTREELEAVAHRARDTSLNEKFKLRRVLVIAVTRGARAHRRAPCGGRDGWLGCFRRRHVCLQLGDTVPAKDASRTYVTPVRWCGPTPT